MSDWFEMDEDFIRLAADVASLAQQAKNALLEREDVLALAKVDFYPRESNTSVYDEIEKWLNSLPPEGYKLFPWIVREFKRGEASRVEDENGERRVQPGTHFQGITYNNDVSAYSTIKKAIEYMSKAKERNVSLPDMKARDFGLEQLRTWVRDMSEVDFQGEWKDSDTVYTFKDGWTVAMVGAEDVKREGVIMKNCLKDSDEYAQKVMNGQSTIFSLRDPNGVSHVTWEVDGNVDPSRPPDLSWGEQFFVIQELGKANTNPTDKYGAYIDEWLESLRDRDWDVGMADDAHGEPQFDEPERIYPEDLEGYQSYHEDLLADEAHMYETDRTPSYFVDASNRNAFSEVVEEAVEDVVRGGDPKQVAQVLFSAYHGHDWDAERYYEWLWYTTQIEAEEMYKRLVPPDPKVLQLAQYVKAYVDAHNRSVQSPTARDDRWRQHEVPGRHENNTFNARTYQDPELGLTTRADWYTRIEDSPHWDGPTQDQPEPRTAGVVEESFLAQIEQLRQLFAANDFAGMKQLADNIAVSAKGWAEETYNFFGSDQMKRWHNFLAYIGGEEARALIKDHTAVDFARGTALADLGVRAERISQVITEKKLEGFRPGWAQQYLDGQIKGMRLSGQWEELFQILAKEPQYAEAMKDPEKAIHVMRLMIELGMTGYSGKEPGYPAYAMAKEAETAVEEIRTKLEYMDRDFKELEQNERAFLARADAAWHKRFDSVYLEGEMTELPSTWMSWPQIVPNSLPANFSKARLASGAPASKLRIAALPHEDGKTLYRISWDAHEFGNAVVDSTGKLVGVWLDPSMRHHTNAVVAAVESATAKPWRTAAEEREPDYVFVWYGSELRVLEWDHNLRFRDMLEALLDDFGVDYGNTAMDIDTMDVAAGNLYVEDGNIEIEHEQLCDPETREYAEKALREWWNGKVTPVIEWGVDEGWFSPDGVVASVHLAADVAEIAKRTRDQLLQREDVKKLRAQPWYTTPTQQALTSQPEKSVYDAIGQILRWIPDEGYKLMPWVVREVKRGQINALLESHSRDILRQATKWMTWSREHNKPLPDIMSKQFDFGQMEKWVYEMNSRETQEEWEDSTRVYRFDDGWTIDRVGAKDLPLEGKLMNHCVGGQDYVDKTVEGISTIYSLRDPNGKPHVTVEVVGNAHPDDALKSSIPKEWGIVQEYGHSDTTPKPEYKERMEEWYKHLGEHNWNVTTGYLDGDDWGDEEWDTMYADPVHVYEHSLDGASDYFNDAMQRRDHLEPDEEGSGDYDSRTLIYLTPSHIRNHSNPDALSDIVEEALLEAAAGEDPQGLARVLYTTAYHWNTPRVMRTVVDGRMPYPMPIDKYDHLMDVLGRVEQQLGDISQSEAPQNVGLVRQWIEAYRESSLAHPDQGIREPVSPDELQNQNMGFGPRRDYRDPVNRTDWGIMPNSDWFSQVEAQPHFKQPAQQQAVQT